MSSNSFHHICLSKGIFYISYLLYFAPKTKFIHKMEFKSFLKLKLTGGIFYFLHKMLVIKKGITTQKIRVGHGAKFCKIREFHKFDQAKFCFWLIKICLKTLYIIFVADIAVSFLFT